MGVEPSEPGGAASAGKSDSDGGEPLTLRPADGSDLDEIIEVCGRALSWADTETDADFFRWKHVANPFGRSPMWVAVDTDAEGDPIVGVRTMMRWFLECPGEEQRTLARAVDTATLPEYQGRGIFSRLTLLAVEQLRDDGVSAVFNTPNDKSRPGYLKMGWETVGKVPVVLRPRSPLTLLAMARSRVAAEKWGVETDVGLEPATALDDEEAIRVAIRSRPEPAEWSTPLSLEYLRWRTGFEPLQCRIAPIGGSLANGFVVFRLRRRGELLQLSILHVVGAIEAGALRSAIGRLLADTGADVALGSGNDLSLRQLMVPLRGAGPLLTWRVVADDGVPSMDELDLPLGAIELF